MKRKPYKRKSRNKENVNKKSKNTRLTDIKFNKNKFIFTNSWLDKLTHPAKLNSEDSGNVVYILIRSDNCLNKMYAGETDNIKRRWMQHNCLLSGGASKVKKWIKEGYQAEPVCLIKGFKSESDALAFEMLIQKLKFKQFKQLVPDQWTYKKTKMNTRIPKYIRRLLVSLKTNRWNNYNLQICWFNTLLRPNYESLKLNVNHSECLFDDDSNDLKNSNNLSIFNGFYNNFKFIKN